MVSLNEYDYMQLMDQMPVSQKVIEILQGDDGTYLGDRKLRRYMITYGAYLAFRIAEEHGLEQEYLFGHIDTDELAKCGYYLGGKEGYHRKLLTDYIMGVVDALCITARCGIKIQKEVYDRIVDARVAWMNEHKKEPGVEILAEKAGVSVQFAGAVQEDERWKKQRAVRVVEERERFFRLMESVKHGNYPYVLKINLIHTFSEMRAGDRIIFYYMFGIYDGIERTAGQAAVYFGMEPEQAGELLLFVMKRRHRYNFRRILSRENCICEETMEYLKEEDKEAVFKKMQEHERKKIRDYFGLSRADRICALVMNYLGEEGREEMLAEFEERRRSMHREYLEKRRGR